MQQRSSSSSSGSLFSGDENGAIINIGAEQQQPQQQHTKRRRTADDYFLDGGLPLYHLRTSATVRREFFGRSSRSPAEKWIHAIPTLVLLCLFTLWWFSFPVDVEIKDDRITAIRQIGTPIPNDTRIDLTILAVSAASPIPSIPQNLSGEDETHLNPASSPN